MRNGGEELGVGREACSEWKKQQTIRSLEGWGCDDKLGTSSSNRITEMCFLI